MCEGTVEIWLDNKGYGWICMDDNEKIWTVFSYVMPNPQVNDGRRALMKGQRVRFHVLQHNGADHHRQFDGARVAINVQVIRPN